MIKMPSDQNVIKPIVDTYSSLLKEYAMFFARGFASETDTAIFSANEFVSCTKELFDKILKCPLDTFGTISETARPILHDPKPLPLSVFWEKNNQITK
jgi:hypothetical protein